MWYMHFFSGLFLSKDLRSIYAVSASQVISDLWMIWSMFKYLPAIARD